MPLVSAAIIFFLCIAPVRRIQNTPASGVGHVGLIQKDAAFQVVPADRGGAYGDVWFNAAAPTFAFRLSAVGLKPGVHYLIELNVDDVTYELTSRPADPRGAVKLDTTLSRFATGACDGGEYARPRSVSGNHRIKFLVKRDGNPATGTKRAHSTLSSPPAVACHGNGDDNFTYALFEDNVARFTGTR